MKADSTMSEKQLTWTKTGHSSAVIFGSEEEGQAEIKSKSEKYSLKSTNHTNETGPLPLCTFSVMGLSMCSSIFSESSPLRSKIGHN